MSAEPLRIETDAEGRSWRYFDGSGDGVADCAEVCDSGGVLTALAYDSNQDGDYHERIDLAVSRKEAPELWVILDSVPYEMVRTAWDAGRFPGFGPPARIISPFPVMTDPSLSEFFGRSPTPGVESLHFDGERLSGGLSTYSTETNAPWVADTTYALDGIYHGLAYEFPYMWCRHELKRIRETLFEARRPRTVGYMMSTSALGARHGREGHEFALELAARYVRQLLFETQGRLRITLMSDHGHGFAPEFRRVRIGRELARRGYQPRNELDGPDDVVVPEFGAVSCVAVHTRSPARVAETCVQIEGVELATYREGESVVVLSANGSARIEVRTAANAQPTAFRYTAVKGDPLELAAIVGDLGTRGRLDADGFADAEHWFAATTDHIYPDPLARLWRAFDGLLVHPPDVGLSLAPGWYGSSTFIDAAINVSATHGDLRRESSSGFVMTMNPGLPPVVRMSDLREKLVRASAQPGRGAQGRESTVPPN